MNRDKGVLYTIEIDWVNKEVMLNLPVTNEKLIITREAAHSISNCFDVIDVMNPNGR